MVIQFKQKDQKKVNQVNIKGQQKIATDCRKIEINLSNF